MTFQIVSTDHRIHRNGNRRHDCQLRHTVEHCLGWKIKIGIVRRSPPIPDLNTTFLRRSHHRERKWLEVRRENVPIETNDTFAIRDVIYQTNVLRVNRANEYRQWTSHAMACHSGLPAVEQKNLVPLSIIAAMNNPTEQNNRSETRNRWRERTIDKEIYQGNATWRENNRDQLSSYEKKMVRR